MQQQNSDQLKRPTPHKFSLQTIQTSRGYSKVSASQRLTTEPHRNQTVPLQEEWQVIEARRENYLNALFNRRKTMLETISRKNRDIYLRITNQESHYPHPQPNQTNTLQDTLASTSRELIALSRHAMRNPSAQPRHSNQSHQPLSRQPLQPLHDKENICPKVETTGDAASKLIGLLEKVKRSNLAQIVESRYVKESGISGRGGGSRMVGTSWFSKKNGLGRTGRAPSCPRGRNCDIFTNF